MRKITRRRFLKTSAAAGAASALTAVPAGAAPHVPPSRPFTVDGIFIYPYPHFRNRIPTDGTGVVTFENIRMEAIVRGVRPGPADPWELNSPTEHWTTRIQYLGPNPQTGDPSQMVTLWDGVWNHQNAAMQDSQTMEMFAFNAYRPLNGPHLLRFTTTGDETGDFSEVTVPFIVDIP